MDQRELDDNTRGFPAPAVNEGCKCPTYHCTRELHQDITECEAVVFVEVVPAMTYPHHLPLLCDAQERPYSNCLLFESLRWTVPSTCLEGKREVRGRSEGGKVGNFELHHY